MTFHSLVSNFFTIGFRLPICSSTCSANELLDWQCFVLSYFIIAAMLSIHEISIYSLGIFMVLHWTICLIVSLILKKLGPSSMKLSSFVVLVRIFWGPFCPLFYYYSKHLYFLGFVWGRNTSLMTARYISM